ncbi:helicase C-terminal domain-containing protein [Yoonia sp. GPGPB17]|uniref:helicase C-terminal domain-containing protein n=1 Tax=Yoonia sp. GPGPB17 TaxID=3026147 RepID=UPI0030BF2051
MTNGGTHTITTVNILAALHATITSLLVDLWQDTDPVRQTRAVNRLIDGLTGVDEDEMSDMRAEALASARDAKQFSAIATLVDLHRVVLTYVTNKKGGDVVLDALQDVSRETHRYDGLPEDELKLDLISGGVDMENIERVMREAERAQTQDGEFVPLSDGLRNIVATSAISHGVDVDRFNSMVFAGIPSNIAEYIQASSRVGRAHVGFSLLVPTPQSRRDRYVVEVHRPFHRFLERMISPLSD